MGQQIEFESFRVTIARDGDNPPPIVPLTVGFFRYPSGVSAGCVSRFLRHVRKHCLDTNENWSEILSSESQQWLKENLARILAFVDEGDQEQEQEQKQKQKALKALFKNGLQTGYDLIKEDVRAQALDAMDKPRIAAFRAQRTSAQGNTYLQSHIHCLSNEAVHVIIHYKNRDYRDEGQVVSMYRQEPTNHIRIPDKKLYNRMLLASATTHLMLRQPGHKYYDDEAHESVHILQVTFYSESNWISFFE
jgi:hypothetical protein